MNRYIGYEVRGMAQIGTHESEPLFDQVPDERAEFFSIYGKLGILNWEWIEDVPDRKFGERRIAFMRHNAS